MEILFANLDVWPWRRRPIDVRNWPIRNMDQRRKYVRSCFDMRHGQSLVVWVIRKGRQAAAAVDRFLIGATLLPR